MDETQHWEQLKNSDMLGLRTLYQLHVQALFAYGMMLCKDEDRVRDCIQELFLTIWNNREQISVPRSGKAYLLVSLRRRIFDPGKKSLVTGEAMETSEMDQHGSTPDAEMAWISGEEEDEKSSRLVDAMGRISDRQREIIHMKYYQQMEYEDIARAMGLNYQSARNLVTRALMALRREMVLILLIVWMGR